MWRPSPASPSPPSTSPPPSPAAHIESSINHLSDLNESNCTNFVFDANGDLLNANATRMARTINDSSLWKYCLAAFDGVSCWHVTPVGEEAIIPCFSSLNGVSYDTSQNASRLCLANGTWAERAEYARCKPLKIQVQDQVPLELEHPLYLPIIHYTGYGISLCALTVALWIFIYFKDLRCVRNTIHTNLMVTYLLIAVCWITIDLLHASSSAVAHKSSCIFVIVLIFFFITNFFWMFVEGLYLYILVVKTFSIEFVKVQNYAFLGWGLPAIIALVWAMAKLYLSKYDSTMNKCAWQIQDEYDYIYKAPVLIVLLVNIFFLGKIMWVLIIKLRSATTAESKQYKKAAKALLVLIPLLGVGYMLILVTPTHPAARMIFQYMQAILVSTQGFTVAVLYCFCNGEVRNSVRHHFERFRLRRTLRYGGEYPALQSTYYRTTACCASHHNNKRSSTSTTSTSNHNLDGQRKTYALRMIKTPKTEQAERNLIKSSNKKNKETKSAARYSDVSDSNLGLFRTTRRADRYRDSCVSFSTTNSFVGMGSNNICGSPCTMFTPRSGRTGGMHNGQAGGEYHSVPSSPENETLKVTHDNRLGIELQAL